MVVFNAFLPGVLLLVILIICLVYFFVYKRHINRRLEGGQSSAHIPMASLDTVFRWLVLIAAAIMLISMHSKLTRMEEELSMTRSELNREILGLRGDIYDLEVELEEQNSLISAFSYEVGDFDVDTMTSEVTFTCTPKSFTEDTTITLTLGDYEIALEKGSGGVFRGTKEMDIFAMLPETAVITITSGGVSQTQMTDQHPWPALCFEALPMGLDVYIAEPSFEYDSNKY